MFSVDAKTVTRWAKAGWVTSLRTAGGHRRYRESEVRVLLMTEGERATEVSRVGDIAAGALNLAEALARTLSSDSALEQVRKMRGELEREERA